MMRPLLGRSILTHYTAFHICLYPDTILATRNVHSPGILAESNLVNAPVLPWLCDLLARFEDEEASVEFNATPQEGPPTLLGLLSLKWWPDTRGDYYGNTFQNNPQNHIILCIHNAFIIMFT